MLTAFLHRIREFLRGKHVAHEMDEEFRFHLESEVAFNMSRGMSRAEAERAARIAFGSVERFREETRAARGFVAADNLVRDARLAMRRLLRAPVYTAGSVATLTIVLAATTAIGALVYGVMLKPLPYPDAARLVQVSLLTPGLGIASGEHSSGTYVYLQERARTFSAIGGYLENEGITIADGDSPERVTGAIVTTNIFSILGIRPALGRLFVEQDALSDSSGVLIAYDLWQQRYGGDSNIINRTIELNRRNRPVLGVLPKGFHFPSRRTRIYYPEHIEATRAGLSQRYLTVIARLATGTTVEQAQSELDVLMPRLNERFTELSAATLANARIRSTVKTMRDAMIEPVHAELQLLTLMIGALLLIGFANVATLSLLRAERLRSEVAVARALGAGAFTIVQRFVLESVTVALVAGGIALPIVALTLASRFGFSDAQIPRIEDVALTPLIASGMFMLAACIGIVLGIVSAVRAGSGDRVLALRSGTRATPGKMWRRTQSGLVATQIALALSLLLSAGLLGRSFAQLRSFNIGFAPENGIRFSLHLPFRPYPTFQRTSAFQLGLLDALQGIPGITDATVAMQMPSTAQLLTIYPQVEAIGAARAIRVNAHINVAASNFFSVMKIPVRAGRSFQPGDLAAASPAVILSASLAHDLFGNASPVEQFVRLPTDSTLPPYHVVGVVGDVFSDRITDGPLHTLYFPILSDVLPTSSAKVEMPYMPAGVTFVVRTTQPTATLMPALRRAVSSIDPRVPLWDVRSLEGTVDDSIARTKLTTLLLGVSAAATLALSAIGLYSVIAYAVAARTREFAVRLALGATPADVTRTMLREGSRVAFAGIAIGLVLSLAMSGVLRNALYQVSATDPAMYIATVLIVLLSATLATLAPARRAGRADPARALRTD